MFMFRNLINFHLKFYEEIHAEENCDNLWLTNELTKFILNIFLHTYDALILNIVGQNQRKILSMHSTL